MGFPPIKDENACQRDLGRKACLILIAYSYPILRLRKSGAGAWTPAPGKWIILQVLGEATAWPEQSAGQRWQVSHQG